MRANLIVLGIVVTLLACGIGLKIRKDYGRISVKIARAIE